MLMKRVGELEEKLRQNSRNSHLPPSSIRRPSASSATSPRRRSPAAVAAGHPFVVGEAKPGARRPKKRHRAGAGYLHGSQFGKVVLRHGA
jgi:hypothetical protein